MKHPIYLNALRAFEASARHQSFSAAAEELHVTPAAVGQLVRTLEEWLGKPLFLRNSSGKIRLIPTKVAEQALPDIRAGLDQLALGLKRLQQNPARKVLTVTTSPAFAVKWLLPRIDRFHTAWPDTDLRLDTSLKAVDFITHRIDIGVRYGLGYWSGLVTEKLMEEEVYPVCSPKLLGQRKIEQPIEICHETLIHDLSMDSHADFPSWEAWLLKTGIHNVSVKRELKINNSAAVLQAAVEGHGIALARSIMAQDDLATGRLVRLFPEIRYLSQLAYYVVYRAECMDNPELIAFRDWLMQEAAAQTER